MIASLSIATPVEIDTEIAALYEKRYGFQAQAERHWSYVEHYVREVLRQQGVVKGWGKATAQQIRIFLDEYSEISESAEMQAESYPSHVLADAKRAWEAYGKYLDACTDADEVLVEVGVLDEEWIRRGRWNRAFLVKNGNGHVHRTMNCSTCRVTTQFYWVTDYSDHTEAEIVEAAGWRACTVCYPSAPVLPKAESNTKMFTPDEVEKQRAREERAAKAAEKKAAEIEVVAYRESDRSPMRSKTFKSERAVTNVIASALSDLCWYGEEHPSAERWLANVANLRTALADKGIAYDYDKALANARKKVTREGGQPKF